MRPLRLKPLRPPRTQSPSRERPTSNRDFAMKDYDKDPAFQAFLQKDQGDVSLQDEKEDSETKALKVKQARAAWSLFFLVFLALAFVLLISSTNPAAEAQFKTHVVEETKKIIEEYLRAPASAKYPEQADVYKTKDGLWEYASYVDSQNAFGAMLRTRFSAIYDKTTYGTPHLVELNLGGRSTGSVSDYLRERK